MDETLWLTTNMPVPMLLHVVDTASERQWRLLICACLRAVWDELPEKLFRTMVPMAEELADGNGLPRNVSRARSNLALVTANARRQHSIDAEQWAGYCRQALAEDPFQEPLRLPPLDQGDHFYVIIDEAGLMTIDPRQCNVIREVFGNPFRSAALDDYVLDEHTSAVRSLAVQIYQARSFEMMPVLGDALEDAGCEDEAMLAHCREHPEHFRGCWALDAILSHAPARI